mmetsp:Transcript_25900/g.55386  ORF Transcript_25900/g.55386 Transcript_25900/m.55386 type:complete len:271 (-) Transcript_25900:154-966(-)
MYVFAHGIGLPAEFCFCVCCAVLCCAVLLLFVTCSHRPLTACYGTTIVLLLLLLRLLRSGLIIERRYRTIPNWSVAGCCLPHRPTTGNPSRDRPWPLGDCSRRRSLPQRLAFLSMLTLTLTLTPMRCRVRAIPPGTGSAKRMHRCCRCRCRCRCCRCRCCRRRRCRGWFRHDRQCREPGTWPRFSCRPSRSTTPAAHRQRRGPGFAIGARNYRSIPRTADTDTALALALYHCYRLPCSWSWSHWWLATTTTTTTISTISISTCTGCRSRA